MSGGKLFWQLAKHNWKGMLLSLLLSTITILSSVGLFGLSAYILSFCSLRPSIADIAVAVVGVRFFGLARGISRYAERLVSHSTTFKLLGRLRVWLFNRIEALPPYRQLTMDKQDAYSRIVDDIEVLQEFYLRTFTPFVVSVLVGGIGFFALLTFGLQIALSFAFFYCFTILAVPVLVWHMTKGLYRSLVLDKNELKGKLLDYLEGLAEIITSASAESWKNSLSQLIDQNALNQKRIALWRSISSALVMLITNLAMVSCLIGGIQLVDRGRLSAVYVAVIALTATALFEGTAAIPQLLQKLEQSSAAANRILEFAGKPDDMELEKPAVQELAEQEHVPATGKSGIKLQELSYWYPTQLQKNQEPALSNISLELEPGKKLAIVGASGSGKSTLGYLLLGWLQPQTGTMSLSPHFSVMNQHVYFFNTSIRSNLLLGKQEAEQSQQEKVLAAAQLSEYIASLPDGLDTEIGEVGMKLSGGQRQRLAVARALLKDSQWLLLDEPTAGLDVQTEKRLLQAVLEGLSDRGLILITHRLVMLESMDEILVMNAGKIVERGTHSELMERCGRYYEMQKLQNSIV